MLAKNLYFTLHFRNKSNAWERTHLLFLGITRVLKSYFYYYYYKFPYTLPSFFPCQEISWKFLASTVCFSLFRMNCTVCCRPIQDFAFGSCDHKDLCANCMLHWLMLYKETTCPTCRVTLLPRYYD